MTDFTRELNDDMDHARSNISQAARLWHESGVSEATFQDLLYDAKRRTTRSGRIEKLADGEAGEWGRRNKIPYLFSCLKKLLREDLQRQVNDRAPSNGTGKSPNKKSTRTTNVDYG